MINKVLNTQFNNTNIMNKKLFTIFMAFAAMNINAQLVVDSLGRVGIGTETPNSTLAVGYSGNEDAAIYCSPRDNQIKGLRIMGVRYNTTPIHGAYISTRNHDGNCYGIQSFATGNNDMNSSRQAIGLSGHAGRARTAVGVFGGKCMGTSLYSSYAGIFGTDSGINPTFKYGIYDFSGIYAGYFRGKVRVTTGIYATLLSPTPDASTSGRSGETILSDRNESVTDKLSQVQTLQFLRYNPSITTEAKKISTLELTDEEIEKLSPEELEALEESTNEELGQSLSPIQYGLDAEQLKAVYPELVYEDKNGNVSINYVEMVPLLVQSINELSTKLAELEGNSAKKVKAKAETTGIEDNVSEIDMVRMDQNKPNPFSESTVITLNIPEKTQTASIFIYDMSGKQMQSLPVTERGETDITVYARNLAAGMYIYTLVVDGKVAVTRRMIVEE